MSQPDYSGGDRWLNGRLPDELIMEEGLYEVIENPSPTNIQKAAWQRDFAKYISEIVQSGFATEDLLCKRFVITRAGLAQWRSGEYVPPALTIPRIYQLIIEEVKKQKTA